MERAKLAQLRHEKGWTLAQAAERIGVSINTVSRWEQGIQEPHGYNLQRLREVYELEDTMNRRQALQLFGAGFTALMTGLWTDDLLSVYARGIAACQDLYFSGHTQQVEALLPLYLQQTVALARSPSPVQLPAARLASQALQLTCELATDREDFRTAQQTGQSALDFAQLANDANLQVAILIGLANIGFHRKLSNVALQSYKHAVSLFGREVTPLLKGRTYAGLAEVYAMRQDIQGSMRAMGQAYEIYPMYPEQDAAYPCIRASRYSLYVFGDVQSRLFLGQAKEAENAMMAMQAEMHEQGRDLQTKLDMLYYQAEIQIQQNEMDPSVALLTEGAALAKQWGSRLYFNKLAVSYHQMQTRWPKEQAVITLEDAFQPW